MPTDQKSEHLHLVTQTGALVVLGKRWNRNVRLQIAEKIGCDHASGVRRLVPPGIDEPHHLRSGKRRLECVKGPRFHQLPCFGRVDLDPVQEVPQRKVRAVALPFFHD